MFEKIEGDKMGFEEYLLLIAEQAMKILKLEKKINGLIEENKILREMN